MAFPTWQVVSRTSGYQLAVTLPPLAIQAVTRHLGVSTAVVTTPYTTERWASLAPSCGLVLYRNGGQVFTGLVNARQLDWDRSSGAPVIKAECLGDEQGLADRLAFPNPLRAADDQTVADYWTTSTAKVASTAMAQLISDQAGPTCKADRQIPGLVMGADPGVGLSRVWTGLFDNVLALLTTMSVASGSNLGVRLHSGSGSLVADIVQPTNSGMKFSADLSNLAGFSYREEAPTVTNALSAGQGDLHARLRHLEVTTDPLATQWGRQVWSYIDRRDTADVTELAKADTDALAQGAPKVSLACNLTDSQAAAFGTDWQLGSIVTVYAGLPDQPRVATVTDVVREISFTVDASGAEVIAPAIGTFDATAVVPTPTQAQLARVGVALGNLARK